MNIIIKEYNQWLKENQNFIINLREYDSSLYTRISPIYEVLNHLKDKYETDNVSFDIEIYKIFQVGIEYLHSQINICKIYLENTFKNNFHRFLEYDKIIGYLLYIEDLRYELQEHQISYNKKIMDNLIEYLEDMMLNLKEVPGNINLYVDSEIHRIADISKFDFYSITDIFVEIAETLDIELYIENEYVVGKDI